MQQVVKNTKLRPDIQPDKTLYGPKAVTIKTNAGNTEKPIAPVSPPPSREVASGQGFTPSPPTSPPPPPLKMRLSETPGQGLVAQPPLPVHKDKDKSRTNTGTPGAGPNTGSSTGASTGTSAKAKIAKPETGASMLENFSLHGFGSIHSKIVVPVLILSFSFFTGFGVIIISAGVVREINFIIAAVVFFVLFCIIIAVIAVLSRWITSPLKKASLAFEALERGDLTQNITVEGSGEFSQMMRSLGKTQENFKSLIKTIDKKGQALSTGGIEMRGMMNDSVDVINIINTSANDIKSKYTGHAEDVKKTNMNMAEIMSNIKKLDADIEEQAESVSQSSASIEEMISNITSITASLARNEEDLQQLREASAEGNTSLQKVSGDIQEVAKESERLLEINKVIQGIASQTNLLAMNAAIEAAHAGDVGRGFAVVADEIRKLAESSSQQAKTVSAVLKSIKNSLGSISASTLASLSKFDGIEKGFENVSSQSMEIRKSMEQQDARNKEVLAAMNNSNEITRNVRSNTSQIQSASQELAGESKNLETLTEELASAIGEITFGIESIRTAVTNTSEVSQKSKEDIDNLLSEISRFST